jgi:hypothetical protein
MLPYAIRNRFAFALPLVLVLSYLPCPMYFLGLGECLLKLFFALPVLRLPNVTLRESLDCFAMLYE